MFSYVLSVLSTISPMQSDATDDKATPKQKLMVEPKEIVISDEKEPSEMDVEEIVFDDAIFDDFDADGEIE